MDDKLSTQIVRLARQIPKSPEVAIIEAAKLLNVKVTDADVKKLLPQLLSGSKTPGVFDWFERRTSDIKRNNEVAVSPKKDQPFGIKKHFDKVLAEDVEKHPEKYELKHIHLQEDKNKGLAAGDIYYQKSKETGKYTFRFFTEQGKETFAKALGITNMHLIQGDEEELPTDRHKVFSKEEIQKHAGELYVERLPLARANLASMCESGDRYYEENFYIDNDFDIKIKVQATLSDLEALLEKYVKEFGKDFEALLQEVKELRKDTNANSKQVLKILEQIMDKITQGNRTLQLIQSTLVKNHREDMEYQEKVLKLLGEMKTWLSKIDSKLMRGFEAVLKAIATCGADLDKIEKWLKKISDNIENLNKLVKKYGDAGDKLGNAILKAIESLDFTADIDLSGIERMLQELVDGQGVTNEWLGKLTRAFNSFSGKTLNALLAILDKLGTLESNSNDYNKKLDTIIELLIKIDKKIKAMMDKIDKLPDGKNYESILNAILSKLGDIDVNNTAKLDAVLAALEKLIDGQVDLDPVMQKLQEILQAIKDHKVVVDVTGKVTCECDCGQNGVHEGIIGELDDLIDED